MTDILLDSNNDLSIIDGQLQLIDTQEILIRQKLLNRLKSFTNTLFTNVNYGINTNLAFGKNTQDALTQNIKTIVSTTSGVVRLVSFEFNVSVDREYRCRFTYEIETGAIEGLDIPLAGTNITESPQEPVIGIWNNGVWTYNSIWDAQEIWGT